MSDWPQLNPGPISPDETMLDPSVEATVRRPAPPGTRPARALAATDSSAPARTTLDSPSGPAAPAPTVLDPRAQITAPAPTSPDPRAQPVPTKLDNPAGTGTPGGTPLPAGYFRINLPQGLAQRFELVELLGTGTEAEVWRVRERTTGADFAYKSFFHEPRFTIELNSDRYRKHFRPEHTVVVYERGQEAGQHYELMEYCAGGTLAATVGTAWTPARLREVVGELGAALHSMHPVVHGDVKPTNVLIRTEDPLDLVMTDFGLTIDLDQRSHVPGGGRGTIAYLAPGAGATVRTSGDWWSMGITILELLLGRNVFQAPDGSWLPTHVIDEHNATRPVPLDEVGDERFRLLLRGLLQRNPDQRWRWAEVDAWLRGESPEVADDVGWDATGPVSPEFTDASARPFTFEGKPFYVPAELGLALIASDRADRVARGVELDELVEWVAACRDGASVARIAKNGGLRPRLKIDLIAAVLQGAGRARYAGFDLQSAGQLRALAQGESESVLGELYDQRVLRHFGRELNVPNLGVLDDNWRRLVEDADRLIPEKLSDRAKPATLRFGLAAALSGGGPQAGLADLARGSTTTAVYSVAWMEGLRAKRADGAAGSIAFLATLPFAEKEAAELAVQKERNDARERENHLARLRVRIQELEVSSRSPRMGGRRVVRALRDAIVTGLFASFATFVVIGLGGGLVYWLLGLFFPQMVPMPDVSARFFRLMGEPVSSDWRGVVAWVWYIFLQLGLVPISVSFFAMRVCAVHFGEPRRRWGKGIAIGLLVVFWLVAPVMRYGWRFANGFNFGLMTWTATIFILGQIVDMVTSGSEVSMNRLRADQRAELARARDELARLA